MIALIAAWDAHVGHQKTEVLDAQLARLIDRHGVGRRGRLEADAEEHHFPVGVLLSDVQSVQRRVHDAYVAALAAYLEEVTAGARHPEHVAEGAEDHSRPGGDLEGLVDDLERGDAHRTPRPVNQLHLIREELIDPMADDRVRLSAAHLHQGPGPRHH